MEPSKAVTPALAEPFQQHVFPFLDAASMGSCARTCRTFRTWVESTVPAVWQAPIAHVLPQPLVDCKSFAEAQVLLARYAAALGSHCPQTHTRNLQSNAI